MSPKSVVIAAWSSLEDARPLGVSAEGVELVLVREGDTLHVFSARCPHRGASLAAATVEAGCLVCPEHGWEFSMRDGQSPTLPSEGLHRFEAWVDHDADAVLVRLEHLRAYLDEHPPGEHLYSL